MSEGAVRAKKEPAVDRPPTFDHLKSMKKPVTRTLHLCLDSELGEEYSEAKQALRYAEMEVQSGTMDENGAQARFKEAQDRYNKAEQAATERSVKFVFRNIGRKRYEEILLDNQPTDAQKEKVEAMGQDPDNLEWDPDQFPPKLIAASMAEPDFTEEQILEIWNDPDWSPAELGALFSTAQQVQFYASVIDLGKG
jgi:hypothetical protein